jgi:hypothetical protein
MEKNCPLIRQRCWDGNNGNCQFWDSLAADCKLGPEMKSDTAQVRDYELNPNTAIKIADPNPNRLSLLVYNHGSVKVFIRTYPAGMDNEKKGMRISGGDSAYVPKEYTGEVSAISNLSTPSISVIEI